MKRRTFIKNCCCSAVGFGGVTTLLTGCQTAEVRNAPVSVNNNNELTISKSEFSTKSFVLIDHPGHEQPVCLYRTCDDEYAASLLSCTHQRCTVSVDDDHFVCPCHGARFSHTGKVLKGPAEEDLTTYQTRVTDDSVLIVLR